MSQNKKSNLQHLQRDENLFVDLLNSLDDTEEHRYPFRVSLLISKV